MPMVCPRCSGSYEQRLQCPDCGARLVYEHSRRGGGAAYAVESWQQTPWGRLVIGLLLAQGLYYVLRHLCTAGLLATSQQVGGTVWGTLSGLVILQGLQAVGVLGAGLLTGAGQARGYLYGAVVGAWNGVFWIAAQLALGHPQNAINLFGEPILQIAFGSFGGLLGSTIWKPPPALLFFPEVQTPLVKLPRRERLVSFGGPIAWPRIAGGTAIAVGGVIWCDVIRDFLLTASEGKLRIDTHLQAELVTWEITALAMLFGSALAGANAKNGLKQGLLTGIAAATILFGYHLAMGAITPDLILFTVASKLCLGIAGGWFGSQLLPPVLALSRRRRLGPAL